jgi:hypothetical protein
MNRHSRLQAARHWLPKYNGKNIVKGYGKHFGVDMLCAATELKMLGYQISPAYLEQLKANAIRRQKLTENKKRIKEEQKHYDEHPFSDHNFYYIAGYTPGGLPYGVTWEEHHQEKTADRNCKPVAPDEMPF